LNAIAHTEGLYVSNRSAVSALPGIALFEGLRQGPMMRIRRLNHCEHGKTQASP